MTKPVAHVTRLRWKWLFGVVFLVYGLYAMIQRWVLWRWGGDWNLADLAVEPFALVLGVWLVRAALSGTLARLRYGAVTLRAAPTPVRSGQPIDISLDIASGIAAGDSVELVLVCQLAEPDSDGVNYTERWRLAQTVAATSTRADGSAIFAATFQMPKTPIESRPTGQNFEVLTLHATHRNGLEREFRLDWHGRG